MLNKKKGGGKMKIQKIGNSFELKGMDRFQANHVYQLLETELISELEVFKKLTEEVKDLNKLTHDFKTLLNK